MGGRGEGLKLDFGFSRFYGLAKVFQRNSYHVKGLEIVLCISVSTEEL